MLEIVHPCCFAFASLTSRTLPFQSTCKVEVDSSVAVFGLGAVVSAQC